MSKLQVKIDGEWKDFCEAVEKPLVYLEQEEFSKIKILTDIRDYLVERQRCLAIESRMCPKIRETALVLSMIEDLQKYAEKLGVEL